MSLAAEQIACVDLAIGATSIVILCSDSGEIESKSEVLSPVTDTVNGYVFGAALYAEAVTNRAYVVLTRLPDVVAAAAAAHAAVAWDALLTVTIRTGTTDYPATVPVAYPPD